MIKSKDVKCTKKKSDSSRSLQGGVGMDVRSSEPSNYIELLQKVAISGCHRLGKRGIPKEKNASPRKVRCERGGRASRIGGKERLGGTMENQGRNPECWRGGRAHPEA